MTIRKNSAYDLTSIESFLSKYEIEENSAKPFEL
jgi:hypothetical protein